MKDKKHLIIGIIIAFFAVYYTFKNISIKEVYEILTTINYFYLIHALVLITLSFVFRVYRWGHLVSSIKHVDTKRLMSPLMIGFMGNLLPARAGEFIRAYLLSKREDITFSSSFATVFVERMFDIIAILAISSIFFFAQDGSFADIKVTANMSLADATRKFGYISILTGTAIILFSLSLVFCQSEVNRIISFLLRPFPKRFFDRISNIIDSFAKGLLILRNAKGIIMVILYTVIIWTTIVLSYYSFLIIFNINNIPLVSAPVITVLVCIFITIIPTPGYVGSFQMGCVISLHNMFNVAEPVALSFGLLCWFVNMGYVALAGIFFIVKDNISIKEID